MSHPSGAVEVLARGVCVKDGWLLVCHTAGAGNTYLPGGHIEFQESATVSLEREVREECGVSSRVGRFLGAVEHAFLQKGQPHAEINLVFELEVPSLKAGQTVPSQEGHLDFAWVAVDGLRESTLEPRVLRDLIPTWCRGDFAASWASTMVDGCRGDARANLAL
ncbi:MAG: NUDIX domain-containing protein [Lentisphaerae bacterium]|nr:NUDIX domain-containing protein [Lentisphaerota bacterium]